jgi:hypothetical protein
LTLTITCPLPGLGESTSSITRFSGGPYALHNTAFMLGVSLLVEAHPSNKNLFQALA